MAQLFDLNLDRYLYRYQYTNPDTSAQAMINSTAPGSSGSSGNSGGVPPPPGLVITGVILRSSDSDNRIEIDPDDTFKAYNNKQVVVLIDKNGIVADNADIQNLHATQADIDNADITTETVGTSNITTANVKTLNVTTKFNYVGVPQPVLYGADINSAGGIIRLPAGWTVSHTVPGLYVINHNLNISNAGDLVILVYPTTGHYRSYVTAQSANTFIISFQQSAYITRHINVKQIPPGLSTTYWVDVPGTYNGEVPVNVGFKLLVARYLP